MKTKNFAVLGLGRFGQAIVKTLSENGAEVLACDYDQEIVQYVSKFATHVIQADITDETTLDEIGVGNFDVVIVAVGNNLEASILATIYAKEKGCPTVVVKTTDVVKKQILEKLGADMVVLPEKEMGERVALNLLRHNIIDMINLSDEHSIVEVHPPQKWVDLTVQRANIRADFGVTLLAIKRGNNIIVSPKPAEIIRQDDIVVLVGENQDVQKVTSLKK